MPAAATLAGPPAPAKAKAGTKAPPAPMVPFTRAAKEHLEPIFDFNQQITANTVTLGPFDIPAYGYMRGIRLLLQATGGVSAAVTAVQEDAPWIAIADLQLADVNGAPLWGPCSGYDLYLHNKYGGFLGSNDPKQTSSFVTPVVGANASGNFSFTLRIPVELNNRDALGALANQNASSTYKLKITQNSAAGIYSTQPSTTLPTIRWRSYLEAWTQPPNQDLRGREQYTTPPAHGTSQYFSKFTTTVPTGTSTVRFVRVGNYIRSWFFVNRRSGSTRANGETDWPDPVQLFWDTRLIHAFTKTVWRDIIKERTGYVNTIETAGGQDNGVFIYDWMHEFAGFLGFEMRDGWIPTLQSTRWELQGSFGNADTVDIITNDIAPNGEVFN